MAAAMNFMSFEKALNPKMTDAYFIKSIFTRRWVGKCLEE
jgi:hypothetical protein